MSVWLIEPRDPIIFRDGRPFNPTPGARAKSLPFPYPSALAGAVRTRAGQDENGRFIGDPKALRDIAIQGPILRDLTTTEGWYFPAPADCLVIEDKNHKDTGRRLWARPVETLPGEASNLPDGLQLVSVCPVMKAKPHSKVPRFWNWKNLRDWLEHPGNDATPIALNELDIPGLTIESRIHVKIEPGAQTAQDGMLFQTSGLEFARAKDPKNLQATDEFALAVATEASLSPGADFLGGERRMVNWREGGNLPECSPELMQKIKDQKACRLVLATPALFENGYLPKLAGMPAKVIAAAAPRALAISGWDYTVKGKFGQKASRRLAPAGSVYFLQLQEDDKAIEEFIGKVWLQNISDEDQDRRDGFGLALLGAWDGKLMDLEVKDENA